MSLLLLCECAFFWATMKFWQKVNERKFLVGKLIKLKTFLPAHLKQETPGPILELSFFRDGVKKKKNARLNVDGNLHCPR